MNDRPDGLARPRWRRRRKLAALLLALIIVALAVLWVERRQLARGYADDLLAERGVPARYTIADLGLGGQRLTNVVLGDPKRPDLTADWIETDTRVGLSGPTVTAIRAGRVRLRGRLIEGKVSLGVIDRLLPKPSGAPIALPDLHVTVADGRMRLDTPAGPVGLKLTGRGNLRNGFAGTMAAVAPTLTGNGCTAHATTAYWRVATDDGAVRIAGPARSALLTCGAWRARGMTAVADARIGAQFDRIEGTNRIALAEVRSPTVWLKQARGTVTIRGPFAAAQGELAITAGPSAAYGASATGLRATGWFRVSPAQFNGTLAAEHASVPARWRTTAAGLRGVGAGTPVGPILDRFGAALAAAGRDAQVNADVAFDQGSLMVTRASAVARSGARLSFLGLESLLGPGGIDLSSNLTLVGGELPQVKVELRQARPGDPVTGRAWVDPYTAGNARLALTPITFAATPAGNTSFSTIATLLGPLGDGRVEQASLPLNGGWNGAGRLVLNPRCERLSWRGLSVAGLSLNPAALALCPVGRALVTLENGRLGGGARVLAPRLNGRLGSSPLTLAAQGAEVRFGDNGLRMDGLAARLGAGEPATRLDIATLSGRIAGGGIAGDFAGAAGRIGAVPLLLSDAAGKWRLTGGALALNGALTVSDAAPARRFEPMPARDVTLTLKDGAIRANGTLFAPGKPIKVADVSLRHRLADGIGAADLTVPGIAFGDALQPDELTPLTKGVIAEVKGTISGTGRIDWTPRGVTSTGIFRTPGADLAALFGPVTGLKGELHFTDLLALESAPHQVATVATINPGVPVLNGVVRYQLLAGPMVRVEDARWPFAGGQLVLEPTLLDYSRSIDKRMTFRIEGLDAAVFLQNFDYKNLTATGVFDGTLPMIFDDTGGRIEQGKLSARAGGTLAYVGEVSQENLGTWGNLALGALKSLKYRSLDLTLYGPLGGEIVTEAKFRGVAQGEGAKSNFLIRRLARLPFVFNVKITAPFRSLLDSARSFYDPSLAIQSRLPQLIDREKHAVQAPVQPSASEPVPKEKQD